MTRMISAASHELAPLPRPPPPPRWQLISSASRELHEEHEGVIRGTLGRRGQDFFDTMWKRHNIIVRGREGGGQGGVEGRLSPAFQVSFGGIRETGLGFQAEV